MTRALFAPSNAPPAPARSGLASNAGPPLRMVPQGPFVSPPRLAPTSSRSTRWRHAKRWEALLDNGDIAQTIKELSRGLDPNVSMADGITPMMRCAREGDHRMLLAISQSSLRPLDIDARAKLGLTAAGLAAENDQLASLDILISLGAALDPPERLTLNPLMTAAKQGSAKCLARLIEHGADVDRRSRDGMSALSLACLLGRLECALLLIDARANVDTHTRHGHTPLMLACDKGHGPIVRALLRAGANLEASDIHGMRALMRAARAGRLSIIELLARAGADIHAVDASSRDAQAHAALAGKSDASAHLGALKLALGERAEIGRSCRPEEKLPRARGKATRL